MKSLLLSILLTLMDKDSTYHQVTIPILLSLLKSLLREKSMLHLLVSHLSLFVLLSDRYTVMGVKINTPHYLAKLENLPAGNHTYTVIVSQLDSLSTIYYTIRVCKTMHIILLYLFLAAVQVYSSCQFAFSPVPSIYQHTQEVSEHLTFFILAYFCSSASW